MFGCAQRVPKHPLVPTPNYKELRIESVFTTAELKKLFSRYLAICNDAGLVEVSEFLLQPELAFISLAPLLFYYEASGDAEFPLSWLNSHTGTTIGCEATIDFPKFVRIVNILSPKTDIKLKYEYLYRIIIGSMAQPSGQKIIYKKFLGDLCSGYVPREALSIVVDECWSNANSPEGRIDANHFMSLVSVFDIHTLLTINI